MENININLNFYNQVNTKLGAVSPLFWTVLGSYVAQGIPAPQAIEKSFQTVQTTLAPDTHSVYERYLGVRKVA